ncbi:hypothetical protein BOX15_Mlig031501g5 [Macrostomum lignano]|uniref:Uncharacterized protein n=1 Tax=Macrostomum lignano TaxID=282301 RepID=A0A267DQJ2_9PLAT|nr:hypothetical protein BOX15_Mlig031501g5 [Macrostomum lignano]
MKDVNRKLQRRHEGQADDQFNAADTDDSVSSLSSAPAPEEADDRIVLADQLHTDDVARAAANQNNRAYDGYAMDAAGATNSSDSSDDAGNQLHGMQQQNLQLCGPDRAYYTRDTTSIPYRPLGDNENGDDDDSNGDSDNVDDDGDDEGENSDGGFGQFGYYKNAGQGRQSGYAVAYTNSNGLGYASASGAASTKYKAAAAVTASSGSTAASESARPSASTAYSSEKRRQKSGSPPEQAGKTGSSKKQQQQFSGQSSADSTDPSEPKAVHYSQLQYGLDGSSGGPASDRGAKSKKKRREQGVRATIKAQDVQGNRGNEDIDSLLSFIENNPGSRSKKSIAPRSIVHPQLQLPQQQPKQKKHAKDSGKIASDARPKSPPSPSVEDASTAAASEANTQSQPQEPFVDSSTADKTSALQKKLSEEEKETNESAPSSDSVAAPPSSGVVKDGIVNSSAEKRQQQLEFTDFDNLTAPEPVQEDAFSVVLSKKERKRLTKRADASSTIHSAPPPKHKPPRQSADQQGPQAYQQHRQASSAHSASARAHNGAHSAAAPPASAAAAAGPSPPNSSQTPASTVRTSSSSRSGSPGVSDTAAATATAAPVATAGAAPQRRPRPLHPAEYEKLLRQKAEENALLRRDLDSCSPNHSQLISFLYSLC